MCQVMYSSLLRELVRTVILQFAGSSARAGVIGTSPCNNSVLEFTVASSVEFRHLQLNSVASSLQNNTLRRGEAGRYGLIYDRILKQPFMNVANISEHGIHRSKK